MKLILRRATLSMCVLGLSRLAQTSLTKGFHLSSAEKRMIGKTKTMMMMTITLSQNVVLSDRSLRFSHFILYILASHLSFLLRYYLHSVIPTYKHPCFYIHNTPHSRVHKINCHIVVILHANPNIRCPPFLTREITTVMLLVDRVQTVFKFSSSHSSLDAIQVYVQSCTLRA
jgi:hypothetical protein